MSISDLTDTVDPGQDGTPFSEMWRLAEQHPNFTMLEVMEAIDRTVWDIEEPPVEQKSLFARINGRIALELMRSAIEGMQAAAPLNAMARVPQWLATGTFVCRPHLLDNATVHWLGSHCDALLPDPGTQPIRLFDTPGLLDQDKLVDIARTAIGALPNPLPGNSRPALLKKRTLLRRTFPPSGFPKTFGNANNQFWHQDSNPRYDDAPMLTLWIPLQDGAGITCPGIEVIDAPVSHFSLNHGDSSREIYPLLQAIFPDITLVPVTASAGDCVIFNGLTFHQTMTRPSMTQHRDALLIRVIEVESAHLFGVEDPAAELVELV